ncbi:MAG TPA: cupin domain-containing protein [Candidatus Saccharimonas sp.]|nr:cupin domain-containing protein [Candidatus Saccharimonas sp.]
MKHFNLNSIDWQGRFEHQKALLFTEDDLKSPGAKFQVIKLEPGVEIKPHYHKARTEVFAILAGAGDIRLGSETYHATTGDIFLCETGDVHAFSNPGQADFIIGVFRTNDPGDSDMLWAEVKS